jgi:hypothetical protein
MNELLGRVLEAHDQSPLQGSSILNRLVQVTISRLMAGERLRTPKSTGGGDAVADVRIGSLR